jgi:cold shock protein|tara:strand:- start:5413 stop:5610 length:198 start_codon:yes stop_codon:yes gene_type:complete
MEGRVKFFNDTKGFGFVVADDGNEYFIHISGVAEGVTLRENDHVSFDVVEGDRGPKAENVALIEE